MDLVFCGLVLLAEAMGLAVVVMMGVWFGHYQGGFSWVKTPAIEFNYHPLFMSIGLLFLYGNGIMLYRVFPRSTKLYVKVGHAVIHLGAIVFSVIGLVAAFNSHNKATPPIPNMYSLHSWAGIITVSLFCLQWALGLAAYLAPGLIPISVKKWYMPHHVFWGTRLFGLSAVVCLMGIVEKTIFMNKRINYSEISPESTLINTMGLMICSYTIAVMYIMMRHDYKRQDSEPGVPTETTPLNQDV